MTLKTGQLKYNEKHEQSLKDLWDTTEHTDPYLESQKERNCAEGIFEELTAEYFQTEENMSLYIKNVQQTPSRIDSEIHA